MSSAQVYLYVEDDPMSREAVKLILERVMKAQTVYIFEDSNNFMARVESLPIKPTIILLDIHVAPHTGFEMLSMLRQNPSFAKTPIVALTASVMSEEITLLRQAGFNGVISKPLNVTQFPALIGQVLNGESIWNILDN